MNLPNTVTTTSGVASKEVYLTAKMVRERYGVSDMSLWRWSHNDAVNFPAPMVVNSRRYWALSSLIGWEAARRPSMEEACHEAA